MITNYITSFVEYLNHSGYQITNDKIKNFLEMFSGGDLDFSDTEQVITGMKIVFCRNREESLELPQYFQSFQRRLEELKEEQEKREKEREKQRAEREKQQQELQTLAEKHKQQLQELEQRQQQQQKVLEEKQSGLQSILEEEKQKMQHEEEKYEKRMRELKENKPQPKSPLTKKDKKFLSDNKSTISKSSFSKEQKEFLLAAESDNMKTCSEMQEKQFEKFKEKLLKDSEKALSKMDLAQFNFLKELHSIISKFDKHLKKENKDFDEEQARIERIKQDNLQKIKNETAKAKREENQLKMEQERLKKEHERIQNQLNQALRQAENLAKKNMESDEEKNIEKEKALHHREQFIAGKNAVRTTAESPEGMEKAFKKLSDTDRHNIYNYIKQNLLKFKTKMNRNINTLSKLKINMQRTIQNTCKTGGVPLQLAFDKPKRSKSDLVLVLDISGSCKEASEMMLTFMYLLKDLFPRGCKTYAFVNTLYDISEIMESDNLESAMKTVFDIIPVRGVYSDYYQPLKSLWEEHRQGITKDSLVIFMGDARNNQNPKGLEYLKDISRKAKSCYWMNTEEYKKWGHADSLAFEYMEYAKMYEVTTAKDILAVINEMK